MHLIVSICPSSWHPKDTLVDLAQVAFVGMSVRLCVCPSSPVCHHISAGAESVDSSTLLGQVQPNVQ